MQAKKTGLGHLEKRIGYIFSKKYSITIIVHSQAFDITLSKDF